MDALFIVVAELLIVPLLLWGLIVFELTIGLVMSVVSVVLGRRSLGDMLMYRMRTIRRRLMWSLIYLSAGLLIADLVLFDAIVSLALGSADDREDLDVGFASAEGSFILGRIELEGLQLIGTRGGDDPTAQFSVTIDELVIDVDTAALLRFDFAVEELAVDGVHGSFDRLRAAEPKRPPAQRGLELDREFSLARLHVGEMDLALRDHTRASTRELDLRIDELDIGPLRSDSALFDLLYRARGHGSVAGHEFTLTAIERGDVAQTTLEVHDIPLAALGEQLERAAGVRASGSADLRVTNTYSDGPPEPQLALAVDLQLSQLDLQATGDVSFATKLMLETAERTITRLGDRLPLAFEITVLRSELAGMRSIADAGIAERISDGVATALRSALGKAPPPSADVYVAADLDAHINDVFEYPPTACRLRSLLGPELERLRQHGGYYPGVIEERGEGFAYFAMRCPQPYCDTALVWVHPDGGMVVAMRTDASAQLWTNRPELRRKLPQQVAAYLSSAEPSALVPIWAGALEHPLPDPPECQTPELEARRLRFLAAASKRACDPEYSRVWTPAAVKPTTGDKSWFHADAETTVGERREDHVLAGDLVERGWAHARDPSFTCAAFVSIDGRRTTGWLRTADLVELPHVGDPPARATLDALATGDTPAWLSVGTARSFGELELRRVSEDVVEVDVEREIAGHVCGVEGRLRLVGPRLLEDIDTGCGTVAVLFNNAVGLWERGCGGARASCTDGYFPAAR